MLTVPESPRWYASKHKYWPAYNILRSLRDEQTTESEVREIKTHIDNERRLKSDSNISFKQAWVRRILYIGIGIGIVQQVTGVNSIMYYGTEILRNAGLATKADLLEISLMELSQY